MYTIKVKISQDKKSKSKWVSGTKLIGKSEVDLGGVAARKKAGNEYLLI